MSLIEDFQPEQWMEERVARNAAVGDCTPCSPGNDLIEGNE
jgi:hypothetical protein